MPKTHLRSAEAAIATDIVLRVFRLNGLLLDAGDALAADDGLTAARWQVLGAIALAEQPLTVPQIARRMGLTRQSVHASVSRLVRDDVVRLIANADHRRSQRVELTSLGDRTYRSINARQTTWIESLIADVPQSSLAATASTLAELCVRLEEANAQGETS